MLGVDKPEDIPLEEWFESVEQFDGNKQLISLSQHHSEKGLRPTKPAPQQPSKSTEPVEPAEPSTQQQQPQSGLPLSLILIGLLIVLIAFIVMRLDLI